MLQCEPHTGTVGSCSPADEDVIGGERERFIPSHNIIKICYQNHCALQMLDSRSNMVITDLLPGAPLMFLLAILAAHPVYISV